MTEAPGRPANWAGNVVFRAARVLRPRSTAELQEMVAAGGKVHALGTGHSFSRITDTDGDLISAADLPVMADIDVRRRTVSVSAGLRCGDLAQRLHATGFALHNLASLPDISVAGACATATHGSGNANACLAAAVREIEMVTASGEAVVLRQGTDPDFPGAVVALGALGIVTRLELGIRPAFEIRQYVYDGVPASSARSHLAEILASGYSVSVFTSWRGGRDHQIWVKQLAGTPSMGPRWMGGLLADGPRHPVPGMDPANCTTQLGVPGPSHERLPHFRSGVTPSAGTELQSEYLVFREAAPDALAALSALGALIAPVLQISEIRTVAADDLWLSPAYQRETVAFHFTWLPDAGAVAPVTAAIEAALAPLGARPHWGKVFSVPPEDVCRLYPHWGDFAALTGRYDPGARFGNEFTGRYFPAPG